MAVGKIRDVSRLDSFPDLDERKREFFEINRKKQNAAFEAKMTSWTETLLLYKLAKSQSLDVIRFDIQK